MSLDKAIEHGKEKRKPYRRAKAVDRTCRNHGSCKWCEGNRLYQSKKENERMRERMKESYKHAEVTNISPFGIWILVNGDEFFMSYKEYPFFENAPIKAIAILEIDSAGNLHWPELDVDIEADTLRNPENYPLIYR